MAHPRSLIYPLRGLAISPIAPLSRCTSPLIAASRAEVPRIVSIPHQSIRYATTFKNNKASKRAKKTSPTFQQPDLGKLDKFSLVDAMRYIRAFEVGRNPSSSKYEMAVRLRTLRNGPAIRNRLRLPHPVKTDLRIAVIAAPDSKAAADARASGAVLIGEEDIFAQIKADKVAFDRLICTIESFPKLTKANLGRILGPKGLMPSAKAGTVVTQTAVGSIVRNMVSGAEYREKLGVIRMAVGQLGFTPEQMMENIVAFTSAIKKDISQLQGRISKEVHEVVLSSTNSPGFTLNGDFKGPNSISPKELEGPI
ncbi:mitochondrial 54S ribosomal protein MRPL1 [Pyrenophora tritici-repentis]|nr:mitochondrial 54S ribosomal protein MRPL1 [Pyrenophora tritici-repentis]